MFDREVPATARRRPAARGFPLSETRTDRASARVAKEADGVVLAVDFGGSKVAACACSPDGRVLAQDVVPTTPPLGAGPNYARGVELASRLAAGAPVLAVGASTFGIPLDDGVALSPAIGGWDRLPLRRRLERTFGAPVEVATDVKLAAAAEARGGALRDSDPAIYLNLGTGLAIAVVVGGEVLRGAHGAAGEIGYALLRRRSGGRGADGASAAPRRPGLLEDVVSGMGLARALGALEKDGKGDGDGGGAPEGRTADDADRVARLFEVAANGDARLGRILDEFLDELCFHMVNLAVAVDPARIAVGGGIVRAWGRIEGRLRESLEAHVPYPPELVVGAYPDDAALRGAVDLGLALAAGAPADGRRVAVP